MNHCLRFTFLLAAFATVMLGCSADNYPKAESSSANRTSILLLPSARMDADAIGTLASEAAARPTNLATYRRPGGRPALRRVAILRHPFR